MNWEKWKLKYAAMEETIAPKAKYIPWVLSAILLIILIVSGNQLYKAKMTKDLLQITNDALTVKQKASDSIIEAQNDSISIYHKQLKEIGKRRDDRKVVSKGLKKKSDEQVKIIASDNAVADANAIATIYRTYTFD